MNRALALLPLLLAPLAAQNATLVKPTIANTISLNAYADNWCAIFINGKLVAADSIDFLPHNQIAVKVIDPRGNELLVVKKLEETK